jgi:predicted nucleic acid-binding protein
LTSVQRFLLDTDILSETRKKESHPAVRAFVSGVVQSALYMSVLTLGELRRSVVKKARTNAAIAASYSAWIDDLEAAFADQVLDIDRTISTLCGELSADRSRPVVDTLLAATAIVHDLTLVTRNTADFSGLPVKLLNPWQA